MIVFVEPQMQGDKHVQINSSMLKILCQEFGDDIIVYCDDFHKENINKFLQKDVKRIYYKTYKYSGDIELKKTGIPSKVIREIKLIWNILKKNKTAKFIFFASLFPFTGVLFNLISLFFPAKKIICLHGEIGVLSINNRKPTILLYKIVIKYFLSCINKNTILLFYGKTIEEKLKTRIKKLRKINNIAIDHPYNYDVKVGSTLQDKKTIVVANIGTGLMNKNSHLFYRLAELQKENIVTNKVKFIQVGNVSKEVRLYANDWIENVNKEGFMPFNIYERYLLGADFFVYFFKDNSYYDLCPSGTFFDAIRYKKPIISLNNRFFKYYFDRFGKIGYLFDSVEEMSIKLNYLLFDTVEYMEIIQNMEKAEEELSLKKIGHSFFYQISNMLENGYTK